MYNQNVVCGSAEGKSVQLMELNVITRFHPETLLAAVLILINELFPSCREVTAEQLRHKFANYASFHVLFDTSRSCQQPVACGVK